MQIEVLIRFACLELGYELRLNCLSASTRWQTSHLHAQCDWLWQITPHSVEYSEKKKSYSFRVFILNWTSCAKEIV